MSETNAEPSATSGAARRRVVAGWFDAHADRVYRFAARRVGADLAHDVTAETFRIALEQFDRFDTTRGGEQTWLVGIANNLLRRHWRSQQRFLAASLRYAGEHDRDADPAGSVDAHVDAARALRRVLDELNQLAPVDRELILLAAWEQLPSAEIGLVLDIPASTVRARLLRIRSALRSSLEVST